MDELTCPDCGEDDDLDGTRDGDLIRITCGACGAAWERDPARPTCPTCGGSDLEPAPVAIVEKSRGTQLSIMSTTTRHLCPSCDAELVAQQRRTNSPLMPDQLPTTDGG